MSKRFRTAATILAAAVSLAASSVYKEHFDRAYALAKAGRMNAAAREYKMAIQADPSRIGAYIELAAVYRDQGRTEEAIAELKRAASEQPHSWLPFFSLAVIHLGQKDFDQADRMFASARRRAPDNLKIVVTQGYARYIAGNAKGALELLEIARSMDPDSPVVMADIGLATILDGRRDEGMTILTDAIRRWPENRWVHRAYQESLWEQEEALLAQMPNDREKLAAYVAGLKGANRALAAGRLAQITLKQGDLDADEVARHLRIAREHWDTLSHGRRSLILSMWARVNTLRGDHAAAEKNLREAAALSEEDPYVHYEFAVALVSNDKPDEALKALRKALASAPTQAVLDELRARALKEAAFVVLRERKAFQAIVPASERTMKK